MADELPPIEVDPKFAKVIDPASPPPMRMMAARGIVPGAKPSDVLLIQYALSLDGDEKIASSAKTAIAATPPNLVKGAIDAKSHPGVIDLIARGTQDEDLLEFLVLRKQILDGTLMHLAETSPSLKIVEIIGKNQERLLQNPKILDGLKKNPVTPKSLIDVTVTFLQMAGVLPIGAEARAQGLPEKLDEKLVQQVVDEEDFGDDLVNDGSGDPSEEEKLTLTQKVAKMTVAQKVKLAYKANKEVRAMLIREPVRVIVEAVLKSERVSEGEARVFSKNPSIGSDVLRWIGNKRDFVKNYEIKRNLAFNPKTPQDVAMRLVQYLQAHDVAKLADSTGIPVAVKAVARGMKEKKEQRKG